VSRILHVVPSHVYDFTYQGSFKDVIGRESFLGRLSDRYRKVVVPADDPRLIQNTLGVEDVKHALLEYSSNPRILGYLRKRYPECFIAIRAINIEPLQLLHNHRLSGGHDHPRLVYGMMRLFLTDLACMRHADAIYPISEWEMTRYWSVLPGRAKPKWLPYFAPDRVLGLYSDTADRDTIACLPGRIGGYPRSRDMVRAFVRFAVRTRQLTDRYKYSITGDDIQNADLEIPPFIDLPGLVPDIAQFISSVRAVAILSPFGYGFKTTIVDAIANGCTPLLHSALFGRTPAIIREHCIEVRSLDTPSLLEVLRGLSGRRQATGVNDALRTTSFAILREAFGCP